MGGGSALYTGKYGSQLALIVWHIEQTIHSVDCL
jgi:hypothetical protein